MAENTINQQAHINYEALNEFRLAMEDARNAVTSSIEGKVDTLIGDDSNKSARAIAAEELAKQLIPETAKESLDTLGEIAAWIQAHPDDASAMNTAIGKLQAIVAGIGGDDDTYKTITAYVAAKVQELSIGNYYTKDEADGKFVAIEENKSLMTADEHTKLANIEATAQVNIIETVKVKKGSDDATAMTVADKTITIDVSDKVDKVADHSLVADTEITKLAGVSAQANKTTASAEATTGFKVGSVTNDTTTTDFYIPVASKADIRAMFATTSNS